MCSASTVYDVVIVGCGPVGVIAAHLLGQQGISTLVLERDAVPYDLPRAIHMDHEIMRILQSCGLSELVLPRLSVPAGAMHFGVDLSPIRQFQTIVKTERMGWASDYHFYQPEIEALLRDALAGRDSVRLLTGHAVVSIAHGPGGATLVAQGPDGLVEFAAKYVLACDGGRSVVRKSLGIELEDLGFDEPWVVIDALVDGPVTMPKLQGTPEGIDMQDVMFIIGDPKRPTSVIPGAGRHRRWEAMLLPGETAEDFEQDGVVDRILAPWLADGQSYQLVRKAIYRFHALIASQWRVGCIFLLGDAAHQTPPFFGQGLCHGIRDAANLVWKLKLVLDGVAGDNLLDTYEQERRPQVRSVIEASIKAGRYICTLDPAAAEKRDREMRQVVAQTSPGYVDIIPPLTEGFLAKGGGTRSPVGARFIQPPVSDAAGNRALLDELTGNGFVMLTCHPEPFAAPMPPDDGLAGNLVQKYLVAGQQSEGSPNSLTDVTGELMKWFRFFDCGGVILRPDRYVYGVFSDAGEERTLLAGLKDLLVAS